jgi:peptidoglycan hydrolase CwlO-like protein
MKKFIQELERAEAEQAAAAEQIEKLTSELAEAMASGDSKKVTSLKADIDIKNHGIGRLIAANREKLNELAQAEFEKLKQENEAFIQQMENNLEEKKRLMYEYNERIRENENELKAMRAAKEDHITEVLETIKTYVIDEQTQKEIDYKLRIKSFIF